MRVVRQVVVQLGVQRGHDGDQDDSAHDDHDGQAVQVAGEASHAPLKSQSVWVTHGDALRGGGEGLVGHADGLGSVEAVVDGRGGGGGVDGGLVAVQKVSGAVGV